MNLPQNGMLWQKLREGTNLKFSPSANRSVQIEQLITLMMEPDPQLRPDIDEILLHPMIQSVINRSKDSHVSPVVKSPMRSATTPSKSEKPTLIISPHTVALEQKALEQ